jgi:anti-sigma factor RsiW
LTCREFAEFLDGYLADELPAQQRGEFDRHLSRCVNCARYLEGYRRTLELSRRAFDDDQAEVPADVPDDLVKGILRARRLPTGSN